MAIYGSYDILSSDILFFLTSDGRRISIDAGRALEEYKYVFNLIKSPFHIYFYPLFFTIVNSQFKIGF
jgi:hypothetical protein